jgi:thiosulfate/3-mercaptopyruvate sulfurtransferase
MRRVFAESTLAALAAVVCLTGQAMAQANDIVDATYVADALENGAIVWDVRAAAAYNAGHIPGAVSVGAITAVLRDPVTEDWLPTPHIEKVLGDAGIDLPNREVIVYGRRGDVVAYFGLLTVRYFGGKSGKVYQGGIDDWKSARMTLTTSPTELAPVVAEFTPRDSVVLWTDDLVRKLADAEAGTVQILDVRSSAEFSGVVVSAIRGGHIPGAVNISVVENWCGPPTPTMPATPECDVPGGFQLKSMADLGEIYAGLDPNKETIVYCQSGVRASETAAVLRELGFKDVRVYKPGWLGYAGTLSAPAEDEVFVNIGALNRRIAGLEARIAELEREEDNTVRAK